jgi:hypothetical protein
VATPDSCRITEQTHPCGTQHTHAPRVADTCTGHHHTHTPLTRQTPGALHAHPVGGENAIGPEPDDEPEPMRSRRPPPIKLLAALTRSNRRDGARHTSCASDGDDEGRMESAIDAADDVIAGEPPSAIAGGAGGGHAPSTARALGR